MQYLKDFWTHAKDKITVWLVAVIGALQAVELNAEQLYAQLPSITAMLPKLPVLQTGISYATIALSVLAAWARVRRLLSASPVPPVAAVLFALTVMPFLNGCSASAQATGDIVSWTNPTTRVDGTPLTTLASVRVQWGPKGGPYNAGQQSVIAPGTTVTIARANVPGTVCYVLTAVETDGTTSAPTAEVCKTIKSPPNSPTNVTVQ